VGAWAVAQQAGFIVYKAFALVIRPKAAASPLLLLRLMVTPVLPSAPSAGFPRLPTHPDFLTPPTRTPFG